jgi:hypothetical protein
MTFRHLVAWAAHRPGLWVLYRESVPVSLRGPNIAAVAVTLALMGVLALAPLPAPVHRGWAVFGAWLAGHVAWGTYLAWRLPPRAPR